jgi:DNA repair protein RecO (recombination protein O)
MQLNVSDAIILRHTNYGEADRIVTFFTPEHGRCKGFARNARKSRKRFGPGLEPFAKVRMHWKSTASGGLLTLREVDLLDLHVGLRSDLDAIALAGYGCELVEEMVGDDPGHPQVYYLLEAFLAELATSGSSASARLLFELRLLDEIGYLPHLLHCSECFADLTADPVSFDPGRGGSLCRNCDPAGAGLLMTRATIGSLSRILRSPVTAFAEITLGETTLKEGGRAIQAAIQMHLNRPLRSLEFMQNIQSP